GAPGTRAPPRGSRRTPGPLALGPRKPRGSGLRARGAWGSPHPPLVLPGDRDGRRGPPLPWGKQRLVIPVLDVVLDAVDNPAARLPLVFPAVAQQPQQVAEGVLVALVWRA